MPFSESGASASAGPGESREGPAWGRRPPGPPEEPRREEGYEERKEHEEPEERMPRVGRNPKTGESVGLSGRYVPHFKPGKELRNRVNSVLRESVGDPTQVPE